MKNLHISVSSSDLNASSITSPVILETGLDIGNFSYLSRQLKIENNTDRNIAWNVFGDEEEYQDYLLNKTAPYYDCLPLKPAGYVNNPSPIVVNYITLYKMDSGEASGTVDIYLMNFQVTSRYQY